MANKNNKCVSKTHIQQTVVQLKLCASPLSGQHFRRSLRASIYSIHGIENDVSSRLPNITSAFCNLDLWPPDCPGRPFMSLPRGRFMPICGRAV